MHWQEKVNLLYRQRQMKGLYGYRAADYTGPRDAIACGAAYCLEGEFDALDSVSQLFDIWSVITATEYALGNENRLQLFYIRDGVICCDVNGDHSFEWENLAHYGRLLG